INFAWVTPLTMGLVNRVLWREAPVAATETMQRLRSRKAEVSGQLEQKRAATRFEPSPDVKIDLEKMSQELSAAAAPKSETVRPSGRGLAPEKPEEAESYTSRLLKAKQKVWEERKKE